MYQDYAMLGITVIVQLVDLIQQMVSLETDVLLAVIVVCIITRIITHIVACLGLHILVNIA